ncbi:ATP-grasp domain-containing protein [Ectobacillus polymachus]|uniref:carboxylate--amine ligase n=1 Tax=Ectobacillus polymachus TaxID=1508806 RepID=UPI003A8C6CF5
MDLVFVTDGLLRKSLSATRSLGKKGIKTIVGEKTWFSPSGFSRYCTKRVKYPDPVTNPRRFLEWLFQALRKHHNPIFLPMDDAIMDIVMEHVEDIKKISKCILPSKYAYDIASNKYETMKLAEESKINHPITYSVNSKDDLQKIVNPQFPLIIKPCKSSGSRGIRKVNNQEELMQTVQEIQQEYSNLLIQEFIPLGDRYDVCLLYNTNHEVKATFVQKELRHFPIKMGPSTVQESVQYDELIDVSIQLLRPLNWSGIVEVEFMVDSRTNRPVLMEINPRFWNSLDLAVTSGTDFPYMLYQLCAGQDIRYEKKYEIGRRSRWFFPGDLLHFVCNPNRFSMNPPLFASKKHRIHDDTFILSDPVPGLILLLTVFRFVFSIHAWKMFFLR